MIRVEGGLTENDPSGLTFRMEVELTMIPFATDEDGCAIVTFALLTRLVQSRSTPYVFVPDPYRAPGFVCVVAIAAIERVSLPPQLAVNSPVKVLRGQRLGSIMRSHGWSGDTPLSDEEAITRILDAADVIIEKRGPTMKIADVARAVGVSRQTIYRYFPGTAALLIATAVRSADGFLDRLAAHVSGASGAVHAVVEGLAFAIETLPTEPKIVAMLTENKGGAGLTSETALMFSRSMLHRYDVDWEREGFDEPELARLAEFCLRMLHSFLLDPGGPTRDSAELRQILARWVGPVVIHPQMAAALGELSAFAQPPTSRRPAKR